MRDTRAFALTVGALVLPPAAVRSFDDQPWTPAKQTDADSIDSHVQMAQARSPKPTKGPHAVFGRMELQPRLDGYTLSPSICGFVASNGNSLVCLSSTTDTCAYQNEFIGCCERNKDCSRIKTRCINYPSSAAGACRSLTDYHTVCCNVNSPECYTYTMTFSSGNAKTGTYTALDCSPTPGAGLLLDYDPRWSKTHSFPPTSSKSAPTTISSGGGGRSSNIGAIVGGVVGGVAALALVGIGAFLLLRKKKSKDSNSSASPPVNMVQAHQLPQQFSPQSYLNYPQQGYYQQTQSVYDPHLSVYSFTQSPYNPQFPQQQQQQFEYQQQQQGYNFPGNTASYAGSPPPHTTPSPLIKEGEKGATNPRGTTPGVDQPPPSELPVQHPVGNEQNRAELGGR